MMAPTTRSWEMVAGMESQAAEQLQALTLSMGHPSTARSISRNQGSCRTWLVEPMVQVLD